MAAKDFSLQMTAQELIQDTRVKKPHVVILGAGASKAAFPNGDNNGKIIPLMKDFIRTVELADDLDAFGITYEGKNFEEIYSDLHKEGKLNNLLSTIHNKIWDYFSSLELPPYPTLYDHLVLSLREKDIIATFNWDPFLYYACWRNHERARLPQIVYLHGNVSIGYCLEDMKKGLVGSNCSVCGKRFIPSRLLYPIKTKDYSHDPFIKGEWEILKTFLKYAYMLTIFGFSAPASDVEAIAIMKEAWGSQWSRNLEQTEIIDILPENDLRTTWADFIHTHHYDVFDTFYRSSIGLFPRRTCEAEWGSAMECRLLEQFPVPRTLNYDELWSWYTPLFDEEK